MQIFVEISKSRGREIDIEEIKELESVNLKKENTNIFDFYDLIKNYGVKPYKDCLKEIDAIMGKVVQKKQRSEKIRKKKKEKIKILKDTGEFLPKSELKKKIKKSKETVVSKTKPEKIKEKEKKKKVNEKTKEKKKDKDAVKEKNKKIETEAIKGNKWGMDKMHPSWIAKQKENESGFLNITKNKKSNVIDL